MYYAGSFQTDLQLVPRPGAIGFWLTVGNATFYSLQTMQFGSTGLTFDALLEGDFRAPTGISVTAVGTYGTFQTGGYICNETGCGFIRTGSAFSARDGGFGKVSNVQVRVRLMTNSPQTAIADLTEDLLAAGLPKGTTNSLLAKLGGALDKLDPYAQDRFAARNKLDAFISEVAALRDKQGITPTTADRLMDKAQAAQALIY